MSAAEDPDQSRSNSYTAFESESGCLEAEGEIGEVEAISQAARCLRRSARGQTHGTYICVVESPHDECRC